MSPSSGPGRRASPRPSAWPGPDGTSSCWTGRASPRDKYCGDGLTTGALRLLEHLGLDPVSVPSWHVATSLVIRSPSGQEVAYPFPPDGQYAATAQRHDLDAALVDLARQAGVKILDGCACNGV